jgi:glycosyltransferase involved in cell wall biosynthesis
MIGCESICVVIPCYNEGKTIGSLVNEVRLIVPNILVVDDGSRDNTAAEACGRGAEVLRNRVNAGKGSALRLGLGWADQRGFEWAITMDGDGQHAPGDLSKFLNALGSASMIIGNRMAARGQMPWIRYRVNRLMSFLISRWAGRELPDTQCGYRLIRLDVWREFQPATDRFEVESEFLLACVRAGVSTRFIPIEVIYNDERSKISPVKDTFRWLRWAWHARTRPIPMEPSPEAALALRVKP